MSEISATEASKRFADLLDAVEHRGETFTVVRRGRVVATIAPARRGTGADLRRILADHPPDDRWADDLRGPAPLRRRGPDHRSVERLIVDTGVLIAIERGRQIDTTLLPTTPTSRSPRSPPRSCSSASNWPTRSADQLARPPSTRSSPPSTSSPSTSTSPATTPPCWLTHDARAARAEPRPPDRSDGARNGPRADHDRRARVRRSPRRRSSRDPSPLAVIVQGSGNQSLENPR